MLEFLEAAGNGLPGRLTAFLFVGGFLTVVVSGMTIAMTDDEYGEGGLLFGTLMWMLSVCLVLLWLVLRAGYWVVTGV